ncbi:hypothetical protein Drorol1_Dr00005200 [Drosera rotundifolia]
MGAHRLCASSAVSSTVTAAEQLLRRGRKGRRRVKEKIKEKGVASGFYPTDPAMEKSGDRLCGGDGRRRRWWETGFRLLGLGFWGLKSLDMSNWGLGFENVIEIDRIDENRCELIGLGTLERNRGVSIWGKIGRGDEKATVRI